MFLKEIENMFSVFLSSFRNTEIRKVWENSKKLWKHSSATGVPTAFLVLPIHSCFYLNNRVFLSRNYRLIVAPRKFDVLINASRANILSNFQEATIIPKAPRHKHSIVIIVVH